MTIRPFRTFSTQSQRRMRVLVLVDPEVYFGSPHQFSRMGDPATASMECHIVFGLRRLRHNVKVLAFNPDTQRAVSEIQRSPVYPSPVCWWRQPYGPIVRAYR